MTIHLIHLIHHTAVQAPGICYGHYDVPMADTFAAEAAALRAKLPPVPAGGYRAFSSPAARCRALSDAVTGDYVLDERLREMHFGTRENRLWADLRMVNLSVPTENWPYIRLTRT